MCSLHMTECVCWERECLTDARHSPNLCTWLYHEFILGLFCITLAVCTSWDPPRKTGIPHPQRPPQRGLRRRRRRPRFNEEESFPPPPPPLSSIPAEASLSLIHTPHHINTCMRRQKECWLPYGCASDDDGGEGMKREKVLVMLVIFFRILF